MHGKLRCRRTEVKDQTYLLTKYTLDAKTVRIFKDFLILNGRKSFIRVRFLNLRVIRLVYYQHFPTN